MYRLAESSDEQAVRGRNSPAASARSIALKIPAQTPCICFPNRTADHRTQDPNSAELYIHSDGVHMLCAISRELSGIPLEILRDPLQLPVPADIRHMPRHCINPTESALLPVRFRHFSSRSDQYERTLSRLHRGEPYKSFPFHFGKPPRAFVQPLATDRQ